MGATTAIFSLVEDVLLRPLPFKDADRLVLLGDHLGGGRGISVTAREIGTYASASGAFSSLGGYIGTNYELSGGEKPEEVHAVRQTASTFATLGVQPIIGRLFTPDEEAAHQHLAVISYGLWLNRYQRNAQVLGNSHRGPAFSTPPSSRPSRSPCSCSPSPAFMRSWPSPSRYVSKKSPSAWL